jgi:signal transduction histidine kinase
MFGLVFGACLLVVLALDRSQARISTALRDQELAALSQRELTALLLEVEQRIQISHALAAFVNIHPELVGPEFYPLAEDLTRGISGIWSLQLAPQGVVALVTDPERNGAVVGRDLLSSPSDSAAALTSIRLEAPIVQGPVRLAQGGVGVIARKPVFADPGSGLRPTSRSAELQSRGVPAEQADRFWGFATVVFGLDPLLAEMSARLPAGSTAAITSRTAAGEAVTVGAVEEADEALELAVPLRLLGGQEWIATFQYAPETLGDLFSWRPWLWLLGVIFAASVAWSGVWLFEQRRVLSIGIDRATRNLRAQVRVAELARHDAELANAARSSFLRGMSHELRTPLNSILGYSELLAEDPTGALTSTQQTYVARVEGSGNQLLALVDELLGNAQAQAANSDFQSEPVELVRVVSDCCEELRAWFAARSVAIRRLEGGLAVGWIHGVPTLVKGVVTKFLVNALQHSPDGAEVQVGLSVTPGRRVRLEVHHWGHGLTPEEQETLFRPWKGAGSTPTGASGWYPTELTLFASQDLVRRRGGDLGVRSDDDTGVTFWAEWPAMQLPASEPGGHHEARGPEQQPSLSRDGEQAAMGTAAVPTLGE